MINEKVEIQIGARHLVVEMPDLVPAEINSLAQKVAKRMADLQQNNLTIADTSKIALLAALSFAADLERERHANGSVPRTIIVGRIVKLASPEGDEGRFRAVLSQEDGYPISLLIPASLIDLACRKFVAGDRVTMTGRMIPDGERGSFSAAEIV
jgi:cell division protein ZapA (FtsZ GTPase activity inhibitor)